MNKHEMISRYGVPDAVFEKASGVECWLYQSHRYFYFFIWGVKKEKSLLCEFENGTVRSARFVDRGKSVEILTRGWQFLNQ